MQNHELEYDKLLNIKTTGRDDSDSNYLNFPYEASSYLVLNRLSNYGFIKKKNNLVDFGCGKGRVSLFMSSYTKCTSIGIEYNERLYNKAIDNLKSSKLENRVKFININASEYKIDNCIDRCYFFNPFNVSILKDVINNIYESYINFNREILLFFYYISDKYVSFLEENEHVIKLDCIDCMDLFNNNDDKEKISIYKIV